ncbi:MAG: von Willebrand factor type A domain-containing protein [Christensenellales bacterium]
MKHSQKKSSMAGLALALALLMALTVLMPAALAQADGAVRELREGDKGEDVLALQTRLEALGYFSGLLDGVFGPDTTAALISFQEGNGLLASGILDTVTRRVLYGEGAKAYSAPVREAADGFGAIAPSSMQAPWVLPMAGDFNTNEYHAFQENRFLGTRTAPLSTFAADVDTASYAQVRQMILRGEPVPADSVRIEEMLNYFHYDYAAPEGQAPFGVTMALADCPWNKETRLLLIGLQAAEIPREERPRQNLVFLIDVSGSMDDPAKLPLVKRAFQLLIDQLDAGDTVSLVTYASRDEVVLDGVMAGEKTTLMAAIDSLSAGGMTAGAAGITTAYELAKKHFIPGGSNRVLLATDGDLNVGVSDEGSLARLVEEKKEGGIFLSVLGFGDGNYKDNKLEALADRGDGNYHYIDTIFEARRALVTEIGATFQTVAKDVKLQVDFNPAAIRGYRLIGYENRLMAAEDFADDTRDGGEVGSGHRVSVLYELVPVGSPFDMGEAESKYQGEVPAEATKEMLTLSIRAKAPDGDKSSLYTYPLAADAPLAMDDNLRFAAAVAQTGMLLRESLWKGSATYASTLDLLRACASVTGDPYKEEFVYLVTLLDRAARLNH